MRASLPHQPVESKQRSAEAQAAGPIRPVPLGSPPFGVFSHQAVRRGELHAPVAAHLQRTIGNAAVSRLFATGGPQMGAGGDILEDGLVSAGGRTVHSDARSQAVDRKIGGRRSTSPDQTSRVEGEGARESRLMAQELLGTMQQGPAPTPAVRRHPERSVVQRSDTQQNLAKVTDAGVNVTNARSDRGQVGHAMNVWVAIDAGKHPLTPPGARPNTVYGVELEYWEHVDVPYDNKGAKGVKPWNDIHGMKPDASTFGTPAAGTSMTWHAAVTQARQGSLTGNHRIGFCDYPGLYEKPKRRTERTLDFRIIFSDGTTRKEILATQLLRMKRGKLGYSSYVDNLGTHLESHGYGRDDYEPGAKTETDRLEDETDRLDASQLPSLGGIVADIPQAARQSVQTFVADILNGRARPFVDRELLAFVAKVEQARQQGAPSDWFDTFSQALTGDVTGGVAAGQFLLPRIRGTKRYEHPVVGGGLLVAFATGRTVTRMYYTDNTTKRISLNAIEALKSKNWKLGLRSYKEIPTDSVRASIDTFRATAATTMKQLTLEKSATHLRAFTQQGNDHIVNVKKFTGKKITEGKLVSVYDPETRDISGQWIKAQFGGTVGFIRADSLAGTKKAGSWLAEEKAELTETASEQMSAYFKDQLQAGGKDHTVFSTLVEEYPGLEKDIASEYKDLWGDDEFRKMSLDRETAVNALDITFFQLLCQLYENDHDRLVADIMDYIKGFPGQGDALESTYNQHIPKLRLGVPATLGEIVNRHFMDTFRDDGGTYDVYDQLRNDFPDFEYRLKPAYRRVYGEDDLVQMLAASERHAAVTEVPDRNSRENREAYADFVRSTFEIKNFQPSVGGRFFDATFDPLSDVLAITVKVFYKFNDLTGYAATDVNSEPAGFGREFGSTTWSDEEKDNWKRAYVAAATGPFNTSGKQIVCTLPGWEFTKVRPEFRIQEVPNGQQHYVVDANKASLVEETPGERKMVDASGFAGVSDSAPGKDLTVILREFDVYDKLNDVKVHTYLHAIETSTNIEPAYLLDRSRLEDVLARHGTIDTPGGVPDPRDLRQLADRLKRLKIASELAELHPLVVKGEAASGKPAAHAAARAVRDDLSRRGVANPFRVRYNKGLADRVVTRTDVIDPKVKASYVTNWSRLSAAHEFGHQIGLIDEYYGAESSETVKAMISAGWLPPETRADHLKLNPPKTTGHTAGQEAMMKLLQRTGLESPDFAMNPPRGSSNMPKTTSLMSGGFKVDSIHLITAWEALVTMTKAHVHERFWKIQ